jgi:hypothetical protein
MKLLKVSVFLLVGLFACSDDNSASKQDEIKDTVISGTWRITYYWDTDKEETSKFSGYNFTFGSNGVLTAVKSSTTITGSWSITDSNSNDDSLNDLDFNILFSAPADFADLSDDWDIQEYTSTQIKLIDVSGGNGGTDYLTFQKN